MAITPPALVPAPARTPLPFGLFSVVPFRDGSTDRWQGGGVEFESLECGGPRDVVRDDCDPDNQIEHLYAGGLAPGEASPFTVVGSYKCSPIGNTLAHAEGIARQRLALTEEASVERAVIDALIADNPTLVNPSVTSRGAIARLEENLSGSYGSQGVLHMTRGTAQLALSQKSIERNGQRLSTLLGTPVIAGSGYFGALEFGQIIATPAMFGYRSEVYVAGDAPGQLLDRGKNELHALAMRDYLIGVDVCGTWKVSFTDTDAAPASETP